MRAPLLPLIVALAACGKKPPVRWVTPAVTGWPEQPCVPVDAALDAALIEGLDVDPQIIDALFPELGLQVGWVALCELRAVQAERCGASLVLLDPELRFRSRRGELLDVAVITDALVHPRNILALRREALPPTPPHGAWLAPDHTTLRHVGPVVVGEPTEPSER